MARSVRSGPGLRGWGVCAGPLAAASLLAALPAAPAAGPGWSEVAVNGRRLTAEQLAYLERRLGTAIAPGAYVLEPLRGCWANLSTGARACPGAEDAPIRPGSAGGPATGGAGPGSGERRAEGACALGASARSGC